MMRFLKNLVSAPRRPGAPALPDGQRVYAVGDIHGRADLLARVLGAIAEDLTAFPCAAPVIVTLGDYIDRGPDSARVLSLLCEPQGAPLVALRGNHEQMLLDFLDDPQVVNEWRRFGGLETLFAYGVDVRVVMQGAGMDEACADLKRRMPLAHLDFLRATVFNFELGDYYFCHAGVQPGVALEMQSAQDLIWIRDGFLQSARPHGKIIVHGHTPCEAPEVLGNRINLDTGAYASGLLTCLRLEKSERLLLFANDAGAVWKGYLQK